jgi:hypothetical protein
MQVCKYGSMGMGIELKGYDKQILEIKGTKLPAKS